MLRPSTAEIAVSCLVSAAPECVRRRVSRLAGMTLDSVEILGYTYLGGSMAAKVDYPEIEVLLDRTYLPTGQRDQQGHYPGWDRHGRVARHAWIDADLASTGGATPLPTRPPIVELAYAYDTNSNRIRAIDDRPGAESGAVPDRDFQYGYDGLDRLTEARRGAWDGSVVNPANGTSQRWALDMLGNWEGLAHDLNNDGDYDDAGETEEREHNLANEIVGLDPDGAGGAAALPFAYDDAGNMRTRATSLTQQTVYTHDAWNRLVKVETGPIPPGGNTTVQTDRYNGLHWRIRSTAGNRTTTRTYSASWQLLQEDVEIVYSPEPFLTVGYQRFQNVWGARYIDDAVLRRLDNGSDGTEDGRWYYLTDAQFSVRAVLDSTAKLTDRIRYSAYGVARHSWRGDTDGDGATTLADRSILLGKRGLSIGDAGYSPDCDLDRSGTIDLTDANLWAADGFKAALPAGWLADLNVLSSPGGHTNPVGYCGYLFNAPTQLYTVRFRHYEPGLGRFVEKDLLTFVDGMNQFSYARSSPISGVDPTGLVVTDPSPDPDRNDIWHPGGPTPYDRKLMDLLDCYGTNIIDFERKVDKIRRDTPLYFLDEHDQKILNWLGGTTVCGNDDLLEKLRDIPDGHVYKYISLQGHGGRGSTAFFDLSRLRIIRACRENDTPVPHWPAVMDQILREIAEHTDWLDLGSCCTGAGEEGEEFKELIRELYGLRVTAPEGTCIAVFSWTIDLGFNCGEYMKKVK